MTSRRKVPSSDTGEILDRKTLIEQQDGKSRFTFDKFQDEMRAYTETEEQILKELPNPVTKNLARETFGQLVSNFYGKDSLIRKYMAELDKQMRDLTSEISREAQNPVKNYATELKKLELSKLEMFKWLLQEELKNEQFRKQEALKSFMAECVNNELAPETPGN